MLYRASENSEIEKCDDNYRYLNADDELLAKIHQEYQDSQSKDDPVSGRLAKMVTKYWKYESRSHHHAHIKKLEEEILIPQNCGEIKVSTKLNSFMTEAVII